MAVALRKNVDNTWEQSSESLRNDLSTTQESINSLQVPTAYVTQVALSDQSIPNNTWTVVNFDSADGNDEYAMFETPSRFYCRVAGRYDISFQSTFATNATGERFASIYINSAILQGSICIV